MRSRNIVVLVVLLVTSVSAVGTLGVATATNLASGGENASASESEVVDVGYQKITISDLLVTISDTHVEGTGLPNESADEASYTVDNTVISTDGFRVTYQETTYRICAVTITLDDVGLELQDVSVS